MSYYNTTNAVNPELKQYREQAQTQTERIEDVFRRNPNKPLSASDIFAQFGGICLITSIRRSLNTLENKGKIKKTGKQKLSPWNRPENLYQAVFKQAELFN